MGLGIGLAKGSAEAAAVGAALYGVSAGLAGAGVTGVGIGGVRMIKDKLSHIKEDDEANGDYVPPNPQ